MKIVFLFMGGQKEPWLNEATGDLVRKIGFIAPSEVTRLKPSKIDRASAVQKKEVESKQVLNSISKDDFVVLLDERGHQLDSIMFSKKLVKMLESGKSRIVFVVAGAFGASEELKARSNYTLSLSSMVFNHHLAQLVICEQVYRALTIWKNIPYHNE